MRDHKTLNTFVCCVVCTSQNVLITSSGAWKLAGFGFAVSTDNTTGDTASSAFHYAVSGTVNEICEIRDFQINHIYFLFF